MSRAWLLPILAASLLLAAPVRPMSLQKDFGAVPGAEHDNTAALRKAASYCAANPGTVLVMEPGVYRLRDDRAVATERDVLAGAFGDNPEPVMFNPKFAYAKGMDFTGARDCTVRAAGATLLVDGWMEPVTLQDCANFRLEGLTIDELRRPHSIGKVVKVDGDWAEVQFDGHLDLTDATPFMKTLFFQASLDRLVQRDYSGDHQRIGKNLFRMKIKLEPGVEWPVVAVTHTYHFRPAVLIQRCDNTVLDHVTIHAQPGMGVVGHDSHDILLEGLQIVPAPGDWLSTNTDGTHFTDITGRLRFHGCTLKAMGDDATNVHGYYQTILRADGASCQVQVLAPTWTHTQVLVVPRPGDTLELDDARTLRILDRFQVLSSRPDSGFPTATLTLDHPLPPGARRQFLFDLTRSPRLEFVGNTVVSSNSRGVLSKARHALIEDNIFRDLNGPAVALSSEPWWHEGHTTEEAVIRGNRMIRCGPGGACAVYVGVDARDALLPGLHKHILIEGNTVEGADNPAAMSIHNADDVTIRRNTVTGCAKVLEEDRTTGIHLE